MIVGAWFVAVAVAGTEPACAPVEATSAEGSAVLIRSDGDLQVVPADGDRVVVEACGGAGAKLRLRGSVWEVVGRGSVDSLIVRLPTGIGAVTVHEHEGTVATSVAARVAVVSSVGPLDVRGAESLRVAYHQGDVTVHDLAGDLTADHVSGRLSGSIRGELRVDDVDGPVEVSTPAGGLPVSAR
jgi:hypothetical protein